MTNNSEKKIAIIAGRDPRIAEDTDGGSVFLKYLSAELVNRNNKVDIFTPLGVTAASFKKEKAEEQLKEKNNEINPKFNHIPLKERSLPVEKGSDYFLRRIERSKEVADFFKENSLFNYDLVYVLHLANAFFLVSQNLLPLEKTVFFPMMTSAHYSIFSEVPEEYTEQEKQVLSKAKHISSPSSDEIKTIISKFKVGEEKFFKVHRGFNENCFPIQKRFEIGAERKLNLFSANGIRQQKDHLFLIPVVKYLTEKGFKVKVHLTGNDGKSHNPLYNEYLEKFLKSICSNNLEEEFIIHGVVSEEEMVFIMSSSDIAVYPSIVETFGKSVLESVASGLPTVVCKDVPAFLEFIEHGVTGCITDRNAEDYSKEIIKLWEDPNYYHQISQNGIALRQKFSWHKVINDLLTIQKERGIVFSNQHMRLK
ncbi:MAG: glycosyltransferase family 4 protein [Patescibacteria group bacterium]|nr:glycosyltransferase family 4 protein [Patescibacteria group bacterium]